MRTSFYLIVNSKGLVSAKSHRARNVAAAPGQVLVNVNIEVPDALFKRPTLNCSISVPNVIPPVIDMKVVDNVAEAIKTASGFDARVTLIPIEKK